MRVLDAGSVYRMGKNRKHRIRKNKDEAEESSDDGGIVCTHIPKAVNFAAMRKALLKPTCTYGECTSCALEGTKSGAKDLFGSPLQGAAASAMDDTDVEPTIWVCLQCGHQGCDRNSKQQHALKHFETPHSCVHSIVANLTTWSAWCYTCDNDIPIEGSKRIMECIDFLRKQAGLPRLELSHLQGVPKILQATSPSDASPTDVSPPPAGQGRGDKSSVAGKAPLVACQKVKGLSNLGNTCFFNAVMQNLCQTHSLESLLANYSKKGRTLLVGGPREVHSDSEGSGVDGDDDDDCKPGKMKELEQIEIAPAEGGPLTSSLLSFVQEMNNGSSYATVTPNSLFSNVCKKAPRFKGFQQQDSHELLRYLIDVVRSEEIKRGQSGILKHFKLPETVNPKKVDDETKAKIKEYGRQVKFTFLDSLFGGQLVSTITCEECKHMSWQFESILDLSLPVTEEKPQRPNQTQAGKRKDSISAPAAEAQEELPAPTGVEGFVERPDKPNKFADRKNKRLAKKDAKKKNKQLSNKGLASSDRGQDDDDEKEEEVGMDDDADGDEVYTGDKSLSQERAPLISRSAEADEENSSAQEDHSDADVEDNLESETSRLNVMSGDGDNSSLSSGTNGRPGPPFSSGPSNLHYHKNKSMCLSNDADFNEDCSSVDLSIKSFLEKETHILPPTGDLSSGDSAPASLDNSVNVGIKDERSQEVEKLANGISNLELKQLSDSEGTVINSYDSHTPRDSSSAKTLQSEGSPCLSMSPELSRSQQMNPLDPSASPDGVLPSAPFASHCGAAVKAANSVSLKNVLAVNGFDDHISVAGVGEGDSSATRKDTDVVSGLEISNGMKGLESDEKLTLGGLEENVAATCTVGGGSVGNSSYPKAGEKKTFPNHMSAKSRKELVREARYKCKTTLAQRYQATSKECSIMSCLHQFTAAELLTGSNKVSCRNCNKYKHKLQINNKDKKINDVVYSNAAKQFLIMVPPAILTLHLKRFEQVGYTSRKVNRHVEFPLVLDLAPYCSSLCQGVRPGQRKVLYSLYGLVEHSGRLQTGHYTAYVKVRPSLGPLTSFLHHHFPSRHEYVQRFKDLAQHSPRPADEADDSVVPESLIPPGRWFHVSDSRINEVTEALVLKAQAYLLFYERIY